MSAESNVCYVHLSTDTVRKQAVGRALNKANVSAFSFFKGGSLQQRQFESDMVGVHHTAVTQYLSEQLARASTIQASMQQRRVEAQRQRYEKLADGAKKVPDRELDVEGRSGPALCGSIGAMGTGEEQGVDIAEQLSKEQLHVFEEEASAIMQSLQADLAAVQQAERQLNDISELQTRIVQHLQEQNEHVDTLMTEATGHGEQVTSGNKQLRRAKERNHQANRMLSAFFVISGMILLLMHCTSNMQLTARDRLVLLRFRSLLGYSMCMKQTQFTEVLCQV